MAAVLWLAGCATPTPDEPLPLPETLPRRAEVASVPFYPQTTNHCGPAALATVLSWSGETVRPGLLRDTVYTPGREGTLRSDVVAGARRHRRLAVRIDEYATLLAELAAGHPVIVFQNLSFNWWPQWHFAVAYGYDLDHREILLRSGRTESKAIHVKTFRRTWSRGDNWGLVVLPPGELPARADLPAVLEGAIGLERAGHPDAAAASYTAMARRWPDSFAARMGLGNARYALHHYGKAVRAFREALRLRPRAPQAWNNLAYALVAAGDHQAALAAARAAVRFAGAEASRYRDTLREIAANQRL